jgi:diguanylate cyclase (GGDEF)-like protein/PAS domain S-box-containing protein
MKDKLQNLRQCLNAVFPPVTVQLLHEAVKEEVDFSRIAKVVAMDPALTAGILNLVNSAYYGLSKKVTDLQRAAVVLGSEEILKIAVSVSFHHGLGDAEDMSREESYALWRLIVWGALAAEILAKRLDPPSADRAYLCTLLKDVSLLILRQSFPEDCRAVPTGDNLLCLGEEQLDAERRLYGMHHGAMTVVLLSSWDIPEGCSQAIQHHHDHETVDLLDPLTQAVALGTRWAELELAPENDPSLLLQFEARVRALLSLSREEMEQMRAECATKFTSMLHTLGIDESEHAERFYNHSLQEMQLAYFLSMDAVNTSGGISKVAPVICRHLHWHFGLEVCELGLRHPAGHAWVLFESDRDDSTRQTAQAERLSRLPWTPGGTRLFLAHNQEGLGALRFETDAIPQDECHRLEIFVRFLSRAYAGYIERQAVLEAKADMMDHLPIGVGRLDADGVLVAANQRLAEVVGVEDIKGRDAYRVLESSLGWVPTRAWHDLLQGTDRSMISTIFCPRAAEAGPCLYISARRTQQTDDPQALLIVEDVTEISDLEREVLKQRAFLEQLVLSMRDAVLTVNEAGLVTFVSPRYSDKLMGANLFDITRPKDESINWSPDFLHRSSPPPVEVSLNVKDGLPRHMELVFSPLRGRTGDHKRYLVVGRDLTQIRRLEEKLRHQAMFDGLTNLYNHFQLHAILEREVKRSQRTGRPMGLMFMDLDGFKQVNDTKGHQAGDDILRRVGRLLKECTREGMDYCCRFGGDEFVVISTEISPEALTSLADRVRKAFRAGFGEELGFSAGLAWADESDSPDTLLRRADRAAYRAKSSGGDHTVTADPL